MKRFNVGDLVYYAKCEYVPTEVACSVCFGHRQVTLILGNGDSIILPCEYCAKGFMAPTGYTTEFDYVVKAEPVHIQAIDVHIDESNAENYTYHAGYHVYNDDLFASEEEALERAKDKKAELDKGQRQKIEWLKEKASKSFAWNAGYHLRQSKKLRKDAEYHDEKARLCQERARGE